MDKELTMIQCSPELHYSALGLQSDHLSNMVPFNLSVIQVRYNMYNNYYRQLQVIDMMVLVFLY